MIIGRAWGATPVGEILDFMTALVEGNPHDTEYLAYLHNETLRMTGNAAREGWRNEDKKCQVSVPRMPPVSDRLSDSGNVRLVSDLVPRIGVIVFSSKLRFERTIPNCQFRADQI